MDNVRFIQFSIILFAVGFVSIGYVYAQYSGNAYLQNLIFTPDGDRINVYVDNLEPIPTDAPNENNQSPSYRFAAGLHDVKIEIPNGLQIDKIICKNQTSKGMVGKFNEVDTMNDILLINNQVVICKWFLEEAPEPVQQIEKIDPIIPEIPEPVIETPCVLPNGCMHGSDEGATGDVGETGMKVGDVIEIKMHDSIYMLEVISIDEN